MANTKISALTNGNPAQSGDVIPIDRAGANFSVTASSVAALATVAKVSLTGKTANASGTLLAGAAAGLYRASFYIVITASSIGANCTFDPTVAYVDESGDNTQESTNATSASPSGPFTMVRVNDNNSISFFFNHVGGDITYDANFTQVTSSNTYSFHAVLELVG